MTALGWPHLILSLVAVERLAELALARHNTRTLLALGAREEGTRHYPLFVLLHASWLAAMALLADPQIPASVPWLAAFGACQLLRAWVIATLGPFWTTRVIVLPNAPAVTTGPYRFLRHPNYLVVAIEIVALPMAFHLPLVAAAFGALNLALLGWRIRVENAARSGLSGRFA